MNARQARFITEYMIDLNATQAAIRAGFSKKTAGQIGHTLLKNVEISRALDEAMFRRAQEMGLTQDRVLGRLAYLSLKGDSLGQISAAARCEELLGKHINMWPDKREITGPGGGPIQTLSATIVVDAKDLTQKQRDALRGVLLAAKKKEQE